MRKRYNYEPCPYEPPQKKSLTANDPITVSMKPGTILTDILGKKWRLGKTIGIGGFGEIYLASSNINNDVKADAEYVAKVESHTSGPLFVEIHCYLRTAKPHMINQWKEQKKVKHLGVPHYVASGSHIFGDNKYRFLIIPRFKKDLESVFEAKKCKFNLKTVLTLAYQTTDILQYIHSKGYVHSDVKASNILLGTSEIKNKPLVSSSPSKVLVRYHGCTPLRSCKVRKLCMSRSLRSNMNLQYFTVKDYEETATDPMEEPVDTNTDKIYLLDYGLASKYVTSNGEHKKLCVDARRAHVGTILFCSRDAHQGVQSRRSDLESLGYNMIYWLTTFLPWHENVEDPEIVYKIKQRCIANLKEFLDLCFNYECPRFIFNYFNYIRRLEFKDEPDYDFCKNLFKSAVNEYGYKDNLTLDFNNLEGWGRKQKKTNGNRENVKVQHAIQKFKRSPLKSNLQIKPILRKKGNNKLQQQMKWSKILMDPEIIMKNRKLKERKMTESSDYNSTSMGIANLDLNQLNPTAAMLEIFNKSMERHNACSGNSARGDVALENIEGYTPAMMEVYNRKKEREELEYQQLIMENSKLNTKTRKLKEKTQKKKVTSSCSTRKQQNSDGPHHNLRFPKVQSYSNLTKKDTMTKGYRTTHLKRTYSLRG